MTETPFTDPGLVAGPLYTTADRLDRRTSGLHAAKISGEDVAATIVDLAARHAPAAPMVCDIGCGRGSPATAKPLVTSPGSAAATVAAPG